VSAAVSSGAPLRALTVICAISGGSLSAHAAPAPPTR
jgi:hypothetical protein